jgi:hypothetical protein
MNKLLRALGVFVLLVAAMPAIADDDDMVSLTSGNRLVGRIIELSRGQLTFRITGAGTVDINVTNVETLSSDRMFYVELPSGEWISGSIAGSAPGTLSILSATGATRTVPMKDVIRMTWIGATLRERTAGDLEIGFEYVSGGDAIDWTFAGELRNRTRNYLNEISLDSLLSRQRGETTQQRTDLELATRRYFPGRQFLMARLEASEDKELDLDSRFLVAAAGGVTLLQSSRTTVAVYAGIDYVLEDYSGLPGNDSSAEALGALEWDWFEPGGDTEVETRATVYRSFDRSRWRAEATASLRRDIFRNFYWSVNLFESYDSDPPAALERSDFGLTFAVGLSLGRL